MIGIIDYGMGNLRSVFNALDAQAIEAELVVEPGQVAACERLIIPGVGAFAQAMSELRARALVEPIREHAAAGKPVLGICLGMQVLVSSGSEPVPTEGLGLIAGTTERMTVEAPYRLPHVGWNSLTMARPHPLFAGVRATADYYFVHSYAVRPEDSGEVLATAEHSGAFAAVIARDSVVGVQFHPEKSQANGLRILENFASWDGGC